MKFYVGESNSHYVTREYIRKNRIMKQGGQTNV